MNKSKIERVTQCQNLPSLPMAAVRLLEQTTDPSITLAKIAETIQSDPAIATKILRTINSSYYGLAHPCTTIQRALGFLGLNTVKSLALSFGLVECAKRTELDGFDMQAYWRRAVFSAAAARRLATQAGVCDPDEAFLAALVQDIGMLACRAALGSEYGSVVASAGPDHDLLGARERASLGFDHGEAGAALAERWRLPAALVASIAQHHKPESESGPHAPLVRTVALASLIAGALTLPDAREKLERAAAWGSKWFALPSVRIVALLEETASDGAELARALEVKTGERPDIASIMARAQEQLLMQQLEMQRTTDELRHNNEELAKQSVTDALTGLFNRRHFDEQLAVAFAASVPQGGVLSLLFIDADRFKSVNDTHGHKAGDAVLVELARRMREAVGKAGTVCRYGGEEFGVILPGVPIETAARAAEILRQAAEKTPIAFVENGGATASVRQTVSVGVATAQGPRPELGTPQALVQAADEAVYAAKSAGRNKVCTHPSKANTVAGKAAASPASRNGAFGARSGASASSPRSSGIGSNTGGLALTGVPGSHASTSGHAGAGNGGGGVIEILLVEDDPLAAHLITVLLQKRRIANVTRASSGAEAIKLLERGIGARGKPDLILSDSVMPGMSGPQLVNAIRAMPAFSAIPIVILTAGTDEADRIAAMRAGANGYALKSEALADMDRWINSIIHAWCPGAKAA